MSADEDRIRSTDRLEAAIRERRAVVGVIGLGYAGLPLVETFGRAGFPVLGFDTDPVKIEKLSRGESYIRRVPSSWIEESLRSGRLRVTGELGLLTEADAILICVPTPLTRAREPDLSHVRRTAASIARHLEPGQLVVLESTSYPGTTEEVVLPILRTSGLEEGEFFLAYSPEREDPGNPAFRAANIPKLVGGIDAESARLAIRLYEAAIERVVPVSSARVAEAAKILENVYRAVNIALVNELKLLFDRMEIDIWEVIEAASTKPFGFQPFYPGPGLGGHCIPIDPFYLAWKAKEYDVPTRFVELAGEINSRMPRYVVERTIEALNARRKALNGSRGLIIGVSYKPDIDDVRESPSFRVMELLEARGATLRFHDPFVHQLPSMRHYSVKAEYAPLDRETLAASDFTIIITAHQGIDWPFVVEHSSLIIDTRNATRDVPGGHEKRDKIVKA